jgi:fructose-1,6-bisphosphatase/inositol monophosphatase family enzyme
MSCCGSRRARGTRGSDAWGHLLVAQGSVDALLEHEPCFAWDWTAAGVIVEEAGGRLTTLAGAPPTPGVDLLVTNGALHPEILAALAGIDPADAGSSSADARENAS